MAIDFKLFEELLARPTAPFRESLVYELVSKVLTRARVPFFHDPIGNLIVGARDARAVRKLAQTRSSEPLRIYIAHTDHPGFHGKAWRSAGELEFEWHGGSPTLHLVGARVWICDATGTSVDGRVTEVQMLPDGRAIQRGVVRLDSAALAGAPASSLFGGFGFRQPIWKEGSLYYTKAADDLAGCFAILSMALTKSKKGAKGAPWVGLLTRAEEVGFIGAIGNLELGWFKNPKRPLLGVSLETSRTLPGAEIGKGPVVRLGDRTTVFDAGSLRVFTDLAARELPGKHQRRVMDGGSCEATAATAYGIPCVGISIPLGNYHNQSFEGGPDAAATNGPAPEFVHEEDVAGMVTLCQALLKPKLPWTRPWDERRKQFKASLGKYRKLL